MIPVPQNLIEFGILFFGVSLLVYMLLIVGRVGRSGIRTLDDEVTFVGKGLWASVIILAVCMIALLIPFLQLYDPELLHSLEQSKVAQSILWLFRKITPLNH